MTAHPVRPREASCAALALLLVSAGAHAGPPLSIDDPGILDPGTFEIILAATAETRPSGDAYLLPILDISYGLSKDVQLAVVATRAVSDPDGGSTVSDVGPGAIGVKWRFLDRDALQMSVAPFFEAQLREGAVDRGVTEDLEAWVVPVQFQYQWPSLRFNAEVRYAAVHDGGDEWGYGAALAYPLMERLEALVELHGGADRRLDDESWLYRLGVDFAASERWHVLASWGSSFSEPGDDDVRDQVYLGLQWFP